jgi:formylglycine-generating enzyme required for sulfatase activity
MKTPIASWLRRLDALTPAAASTLGLVLGAAAAATLLTRGSSIVGVVAFVALLALVGALAWSGEPVAVPIRTTDQPEGRRLSVEVAAIPAGKFLMGSPDDEEGRYADEGPVHEVTVCAFECMRHPVTRRLYAEVMGVDPGWPEGPADERPVNNVSWFDAVRFCNRLSERDGLKPCYRIDGEDVSWERDADGYRLPTEAEWEYACRAGTRTRWSFGDDEGSLSKYAWYQTNAKEPQPVGQKKANAWGLHDVHGNVWEWCWDRFGSYTRESQKDPQGPAEGEARVLRGGSFAVSPRSLRSACRYGFQPEDRDRDFGFRCVLVPRRQH